MHQEIPNREEYESCQWRIEGVQRINCRLLGIAECV